MTGSQFAVMAYSLSLLLLLGYGARLWLAMHRLRRRGPR